MINKESVVAAFQQHDAKQRDELEEMVHDVLARVPSALKDALEKSQPRVWVLYVSAASSRSPVIAGAVEQGLRAEGLNPERVTLGDFTWVTLLVSDLRRWARGDR